MTYDIKGYDIGKPIEKPTGYAPLYMKLGYLQRTVENLAKWMERGGSMGKNKATKHVIYAAQDLTEVLDEIDQGKRDGLGYPIKEDA